MRGWVKFTACLFSALLPCMTSAGQTAQVGADLAAGGAQKLRVDYVHYRPARWEQVQVREAESEYTNQGGLLYFYLTNVSAKPVDLRFWRMNNHDESYWLLNHFIAWHRLQKGILQPGESTVLEINGITRDFGPEAPYTFSMVDATWEPCVRQEGILKQDTVNISYIRVLQDMRHLEIHLRNTGAEGAVFSSVGVLGREVAESSWRGQQLGGPGHAIARIALAKPLANGDMTVVKVGIKTADGERFVCAHRRAFPEFFPIGTWNKDTETEEYYAFHKQNHVDTLIKSGPKDNAYFGGAARRYGFRTMTHTGIVTDVDLVRDLGDQPTMLCWMLTDEPDWGTDPQAVLLADTTVRRYNSTVPTYVNLCRNIKFFEYAPIADIPGHDHYCVTAPSSSLWPQPHGTRLEETGHYTRDLKYASEPKPFWVWSQGNHDGWEERPKRPVPTADEIAAQLALNLARGAKGILWFAYHQEMCVKYPDTHEAMRGWNRVMTVLRQDLLASEPLEAAITAPDKTDASALVSWDSLIVCLVNLDYEIHPEAYPFKAKKNVRVTVPLPGWIDPKSAFTISPDGVGAADVKAVDGRAELAMPRLGVAQMVVLANDPDALASVKRRFGQVLAEENGR